MCVKRLMIAAAVSMYSDPHFTLKVCNQMAILNHRLDAAVEFGAKVSKSKLMFTTSRYTNQLCPT